MTSKERIAYTRAELARIAANPKDAAHQYEPALWIAFKLSISPDAAQRLVRRAQAETTEAK